MEPNITAIPPFQSDGYLPVGLYRASEAEVTFRFGSSSPRRRRLALRMRRWVQLGRQVGALHLLLDGSFVTSKANPEDLDTVMQVPANFEELITAGNESALELEEMYLTRRPEELFATEDGADWLAWVEFFSRTRNADGRRKGLVEVAL